MNEAKNNGNARNLFGWHSAAETLERLRAERIRACNTADAIEQLSDVFESARLHYPAAATSGLVEQQRLFARCRP
ncbi:MAG: hypothetical protein JSW66_14675 [Phycisphaerales bacterium]|nr:MAG: hypothetical protein JSW66_14675 [Phycisphaerales bacterium]